MRSAAGFFDLRDLVEDIAVVAGQKVTARTARQLAEKGIKALKVADEDLYGQHIETDVIAFLRPEEKFETVELMVEQIRHDETTARSLLLPDF